MEIERGITSHLPPWYSHGGGTTLPPWYHGGRWYSLGVGNTFPTPRYSILVQHFTTLPKTKTYV